MSLHLLGGTDRNHTRPQYQLGYGERLAPEKEFIAWSNCYGAVVDVCSNNHMKTRRKSLAKASGSLVLNLTLEIVNNEV